MKFVSLQDTGWQAVDAAETAPAAAPRRLLTLAQWQAVRANWPADLPVAVTLPNTFDVEELAADLPRIALVALQFPKWTDGRAYSQARTLRARLGYQGEVRATGEVLVDMLPLLQRTGVDAVQLRADQREESARRALTLVTENYQGDVSQTRPLFARLAA
ncbi:MAG TPA: DUF934 domain-containing protein [Ideonella sp.]|uniref:DUF934 domain-containing protein n=1 Tax=Ideonella sp. TaxID=1929293 RepID=UPI002C9DA28F|nr:DUF934 domain-containing protein [Ideonella sp.]HSI50887.1 DUF934 domain-containing protein [Ideonella sp.]